MKEFAAAARYARALEASIDTNDEIGRVAEELDAVAAMVASDRAIQLALISPAVSLERKNSLIATIEKVGRLAPKTVQMLTLLAERGHLGLLEPIAEAFSRVRDRRLGIQEAEITTAAPMAPELEKLTQQALEQRSGRKLRFTVKVDPELIGGMVARVGSTVYDGSVRTRLQALAVHLKNN